MLTLTAHVEQISRNGAGEFEVQLKFSSGPASLTLGPLPPSHPFVRGARPRGPVSVSFSIAEPPAPAAVAEPEAVPKPRKRKES